MSATAQALNDSLYRYGSRQPGIWRSAILAGLMHLLMIAVLIFSVRIPSREPEVVTVELWEPPAEVAPKPLPEVKPPPPPPPAPKPEPVPEVKKPDIAIQETPKPKPKPEPKVEPKPKPAPPKRDVEFEKRMKEQLAMEQKRLQENREAADKARQEQELKDLIARRLTDGGQVLFEVEDVAVHDLDTDKPRITYRHAGSAQLHRTARIGLEAAARAADLFGRHLLQRLAPMLFDVVLRIRRLQERIVEPFRTRAALGLHPGRDQ